MDYKKVENFFLLDSNGWYGYAVIKDKQGEPYKIKLLVDIS